MPSENRLPEIIARLQADVDAAVLAAAENLVEAAKERVPVETGRLRDAIHVDVQPEGVYVLAGDKDVFYGHIVEHGGVNHSPHPFLVPALEEHRGEITAMIGAAVERATGRD